MEPATDVVATGRVHRIVLTGGPCGGKTTAQSVLTDAFAGIGYRVYRVPETATILLGGGVNFAQMGEAQAVLFQQHLLKTMLEIEDTFFSLAKSYAELGENVVVICDRGAMDPSAYASRESWLDILKSLNLKEVELRDCRYDLIVHMVTAAQGAEQFYTLANNATRSETPEHARDLDTRTAHAWVGHPYLEIIDNSTTFELKLERLVTAVAKRLDIQGISRSEYTVKRRFLVTAMVPDAEFPVAFRDFEVDHVYILSADPTIQVRLRSRGDHGINSYTYTERRLAADQNIETRRRLSEREYNVIARQADPAHHVVRKLRRCFLYNHLPFQIDMYKSPHPGLMLMEIHCGPNVSPLLPPFVTIAREVTNEKAYSMHVLSLIGVSLPAEKA